ncbi:MAG TPA: DUF4157 domain-containing protein [Candidatus Competibacter sp.]|nr:DUF4157 domain-containing protein [Candidatus Competibacter sp.]
MESPIRGFMESKFRADFGNVRIHTGPAAADLCAALQARAFTWGRDIVFGGEQYAPMTEVGRQLLAHELAHVLQQRAVISSAQSDVVPVGNPWDDCEKEADRLAEEALSTGLRSAVTRDMSGALRRAIVIDPNSAKLVVNSKDVVPGVDVTSDRKTVALHLTKNARPIITKAYSGSTAQEIEKESSAINIKAEINVSLGPRDNILTWRFGFIQLAREVTSLWGFAGRNSSEGSVAINLADPPAMPATFAGRFCLDSGIDHDEDNIMPFTNGRGTSLVRDAKGGAKVIVEMDDHPHGLIPTNMPNEKTKAQNYLYRASKAFEALTVFVARNSEGVIQPLAHVGWQMIWSAGFDWVGGRCRPSMRAKAFTVGNVIKGAPGDPDLAAMVTRPTTDVRETYNFLTNLAVQRVFQPGVSTWNFSEKDSWSSDVPSNFFR